MHTRHLTAAFFALLPTSVFAQTGVTLSLPNPNSVPNKIIYCDSWYPPTARPSRIEGTTVMSLRLLADGGIKDVKIVGSSGNADLDQAAIECSSTVHMPPLIHDEQAVDVLWTAKI
ncbi:MAG TPA: energy transducer TonB, partial [Rhizomicrobium sp.]